MTTTKKPKRSTKPKATAAPQRRGTRGPLPSVMTDATCAEIAAHVTRGLHPEVAARAVGISPSTMRSHRARHADFAAQLDKAEALCEVRLIEIILAAAEKGEYGAAQFLIERRFKERWSRPEVQFKNVNVAVDANDLAKAIQDGLAVIARRHADFSQADADAAGDLADAANLTSTPPASPSGSNTSRNLTT